MRFRPYPNMERTLGQLPGMIPMLGRVADAIVEEAFRIAPEREGDYKANLAADAGYDDTGPIGRANANWFTSWLIEAGTIRTPIFAPLRKAMESSAARRVL